MGHLAATPTIALGLAMSVAARHVALYAAIERAAPPAEGSAGR